MGGVWSGEKVESEAVGGDVTSVKWVKINHYTTNEQYISCPHAGPPSI